MGIAHRGGGSIPEQRQHPRRRTLKAGRIVLNQGFSVLSCTVRNLSDGGACLEVARTTGAAFVYPVIKTFGAVNELRGAPSYDPVFLAAGNYIDGMALISKAVWVAVGGYDHVRTGWEDFDLWCKLAERGLRGEQVPGGPLAEYRLHPNSMLQSANSRPDTVRAMMDHLERRHPWLTLVWPLPYSSREAKNAILRPQSTTIADRLMRLLPILRCPDTGGRLAFTPTCDALVSEDETHHWPIVLGRPMLFPGMAAPKVNPDTHLSNPLPDSAVALIRSTRGLVLHLSAGGTAERYENVVEAEAAVFCHTDLIADVHRLPFVDNAFEPDAVGAQSHFLKLGWDPSFGGLFELSYRTLANESYYTTSYDHAYEASLSYSRPIGAFTLESRDALNRLKRQQFVVTPHQVIGDRHHFAENLRRRVKEPQPNAKYALRPRHETQAPEIAQILRSLNANIEKIECDK